MVYPRAVVHHPTCIASAACKQLSLSPRPPLAVSPCLQREA